MKTTAKFCPSTHGGSGYAPGSYMDGDVIVCGICGERIENPRPTGMSADGKPKFGQAVSIGKPIKVSAGKDK